MVLVHEIAHQQLQHTKIKNRTREIQANNERQAEFVAFNVCSFLGLDIHSELYLQSWKANADNLQQCMTATGAVIRQLVEAVRPARASAA